MTLIPSDADHGEAVNHQELEDLHPAQLTASQLVALASMCAVPGLRIGAGAHYIANLSRELKASHSERFLAAKFSLWELAYCAGKLECLAARLAAKEAVAMAVGVDAHALPPCGIEVSRRSTGEPYVRAAGDQPWPGNSQNWQWSVSLSHERGVAVAIAIATPGLLSAGFLPSRRTRQRHGTCR